MPWRISWPSTPTALGGCPVCWRRKGGAGKGESGARSRGDRRGDRSEESARCPPRLLEIANSLGIDESFCPVRALLGAFVAGNRFPIPGLLTCSVGATCDDFSAIAQRLESLGFPILWWEIPHRRHPEAGEEAVELPGSRWTGEESGEKPARFRAPAEQVALVKSELDRVRLALQSYAQRPLGDRQLAAGIARANQVRRRLAELRELCFTADPCPLPALELLIAEMLAIHFCSDQNETLEVLTELLHEVRHRAAAGVGVLPAGAVRVFWVNPVADLRVMNLLEDAGGRVCGTDNMFCHALDEIPTDLPPLEALARMALADPMVGSAVDRGQRICAEAARFGAQGVVHLADPRRQPFRDGGRGHRRGGPPSVGHPRGGVGSAAGDRRPGAFASHPAGGDDGNREREGKGEGETSRHGDREMSHSRFAAESPCLFVCLSPCRCSPLSPGPSPLTPDS